MLSGWCLPDTCLRATSASPKLSTACTATSRWTFKSSNTDLPTSDICKNGIGLNSKFAFSTILSQTYSGHICHFHPIYSILASSQNSSHISSFICDVSFFNSSFISSPPLPRLTLSCQLALTLKTLEKLTLKNGLNRFFQSLLELGGELKMVSFDFHLFSFHLAVTYNTVLLGYCWINLYWEKHAWYCIRNSS